MLATRSVKNEERAIINATDWNVVCTV